MDLFEEARPNKLEIVKHVYLLKAFALDKQNDVIADLTSVISQAPLRHMMTKMGFAKSASMPNCGALCWESNRHGYMYPTKATTTNHH